jgi:hypothetical protein
VQSSFCISIRKKGWVKEEEKGKTGEQWILLTKRRGTGV